MGQSPETSGPASEGAVDRREFFKQAAGAVLAGTATAMTARAYSRTLGANDRIRLGQLGCGGRSRGHIHMVQMAAQHTPVETVAVCDIWKIARERRAAQIKTALNVDADQYQYSEKMLERKDLDGVMIATGDFQHAKLCIEVVQAGKDCYVEKPFANMLSEAKAARSAVKESRQVVQVGTQHRSQVYPLAVRDIIKSGRIGEVVRITQELDVNQPRWRSIREFDDGKNPPMLKEEDTDWKRWLLGKPYRPFDPHVYLEFRLYKDFSSGIFDQWLSHGSDLVHLWMDETYPVSATAQGGVLTWKDGRQNPDNVTVSFIYPKGFLYTYTTSFSNSYRSYSRINGRDGTIENFGGEGASLFIVTKEGGRQERAEPRYTEPPAMGLPKDGAEIVKVPGASEPDTNGGSDDDLGHIMNWLGAMRDRRSPNSTVDHGFSHSIACIMATESYWSGKRMYWNPATEEIQDHPA